MLDSATQVLAEGVAALVAQDQSAIYLCAYHHWLEHHTNWHHTRNKNGTVEIQET